jgi:hypothetical protein
MSAPAAYTPEPSHEAPAEEVTAEPELPAADAGWVETSEITADVPGEVAADATNDPPGDVTENTEIDREAAFAAIQEAAEAAADTGDAPAAVDFADTAEMTAESDTGGEAAMADAEADPRLAALALAAGFDAAELEAKASADATPDSEEIPEIGNEALAARLAGLVPEMSENSSPSETRSTQVVVVGLVSVASIASFKRTLGRLPGISSVGVSSGPDGEFLFAVTHSADVVLSEAIPGMPAFRARVTGSGEGTLNVTAHDPDSDK